MRKLGVDSFGVDIMEGDTIECFEYEFCNEGYYRERLPNSYYDSVPHEKPFDYVERAICAGYTVKVVNDYGWDFYYKPIVGVVELDEEWLTYKPLINFSFDYGDVMVSCLYIMKKYGNSKGAYIKVIKKGAE